MKRIIPWLSGVCTAQTGLTYTNLWQQEGTAWAASCRPFDCCCHFCALRTLTCSPWFSRFEPLNTCCQVFAQAFAAVSKLSTPCGKCRRSNFYLANSGIWIIILCCSVEEIFLIFYTSFMSVIFSRFLRMLCQVPLWISIAADASDSFRFRCLLLLSK